MSSNDNDSERIAHFLEWAHRNRPGERISHREIAQVINNIRNPTMKHVQMIKRRHQYVAKKLDLLYNLGWDANSDGIRPLDSAQDIIKIDYIPAVGEMESKRVKGVKKIDLVERCGGAEACDDTPEGRHLAEFYNKTKTQIVRLKLPPRIEIRKLLTSHNSD